MFSTLRTRFGIPGVVSVIALVFALIGGAYAASSSNDGKNAAASAKKKKAQRGPKGPRGATGPAGAAGPAGPVGPAGAKGDAGAAGANGAAGAAGAAGANGSTILSGAGIPSPALGSNGDFYARTNGSGEFYGPKTGGSWGAPVSLKGPAGPAGEPWTPDGTLPGGATLTGVWADVGFYPKGENIRIPISFPIPLSAEDAEDMGQCEIDFEAFEYICKNIHIDEEETATCPGTLAAPQAAAGHLCIYMANLLEATGLEPSPLGDLLIPASLTELASEEDVLATSGTLLVGERKNESDGMVKVQGTWALTAP
jgi:hypothetical protein